MIEIFEEHLPAMNAEVVTNVIRARNTVQPPATPGSKRFWRVAPDWSRDSDGDSTPDWLEFSQMGGTAGSGDALADAFSGDTNGNGIPDGEERDSDGDGVPDKSDASMGDKKIGWAKNGAMRFAWFGVEPPADGSKTPIQVNDQGKVLFEKGLWHSGVLTELEDEGTDVAGCRPLAIGDSGTIIGTGLTDLPDDAEPDTFQCMVMWPAAGDDPVVLKQGDTYPLATYAGYHRGVGDMLLNENDEFVAMTYVKTLVELSDPPEYYLDQVDTNARKAWKIGAGQGGTSGGVSPVGDAPIYAEWIDKDKVFWGWDSSNDSKFTGGTGPHAFDGKFNRSVTLPHGVPAVFTGYPPGVPLNYDSQSVSSPEFFLENAWTTVAEVPIFSNAVDFSTVGRFAICRYFWMWHNGKSFQVQDVSPGLAEEWKGGINTLLLDTTRHGWTLAVKRSENNPPVAEKAIVGTPIVLETETPADGLDAVSIGVNKSFGANLTGSKDEFWIMVPAGGTISSKFSSGACPATPIMLGGGEGRKVAADPASVATQTATVIFSAPVDAAGTEEAVDIKLADKPSLSVPLRAKIMKPRVVAVSVWPVKHQTLNTVPDLPTEQQFEEYLDDIFKKQINVTFDVTIQPPADSNLAPNDTFRVADPPSPTQLAVKAGKNGGNIRVYVMGGLNLLVPSNPRTMPIVGLANPGDASVWMSASDMTTDNPGQDELTRKAWLSTVAHEIGHVFFGEGHPNTGSGPAPLPGTDQMVRLMHNGTGHVGSASIRRVCVKAEWDEAETWLENEEEEGRLPR